jgi:hypothetical protein
MAVCLIRWLQGADTDAAAETPTNDRRNNVLRTRARAHALSHGDAID